MRVVESVNNTKSVPSSDRAVADLYEVIDWLLNVLLKAYPLSSGRSILFVGSSGSSTHVVTGGDLSGFSMAASDVSVYLQLFSKESSSVIAGNCVPRQFTAELYQGVGASENNTGLPLFLADGSRFGTLCLFGSSAPDANCESVEVLTSLARTIENIFSSASLIGFDAGVKQLHDSDKKQSLLLTLSHRPSSVADARELNLRERHESDLQRDFSAFEMLQVSTWRVWPSRGKFEVSDSWVRLTGIGSDAVSEYSASKLFKNFHPDDYETCLLQFNQFLSGESASYKVEARVRGAEKDWIWLSSQGWATEKDLLGKPAELLFTHADISAQKKQAQHLEHSQAFLDRTSRLAGVGGWEVDFQNDRVIWCNETRRIYGVGLEFEAIADHYIKYCAPDARHIMQAAVDMAMRGGPGFDLELPFVRLDRQGIWVRVVGTVEFSGLTAIRMVGSLQDVSDRVLERLALAEANERATLATNSGGIGIWDWDAVNNVLRWDSWMYRLYGIFPNDLDNSISLWTRHIHPDDLSSVERAMHAALQGGPSIDVEFRVVWPDGSLRYIHGTGLVKYNELGEPVRMVGTNRDVTNARHLATELSEQHEMLRVTLKSIGDAVITTDAKGNVAWLNPVAENLTGWLSAEASGLPLSHVFHIVHQQTRLPAEDPVAICFRKEVASSPNSQTLLLSKTGQEYGIEDSAAPIRNEHGEILGAVLVFHDVTEQRRLSSELNYRASHDYLTGLVNRAEFEIRLGRALRRTHESGACHTLLYIDLDQFKLVNDACGHAVGDQVLQQVSKLLATCVRERDTLARLGGDEFGVILEHCCEEHALRVAQHICDSMEKFRFLSDGRRFRIGASIGLVPVDSRWTTTLALQQAADTSCYAAKEAGRNRVHAWFDSDMAMHARHGQMQWTMRIEQALDEGRFVLYAQRIMPLNHSSNGIHAEVLLRMQDSEGALVPPGAFLPAAERFHLASRIDRWVLLQAIEWMEALPATAKLETLSINLSGQSVGDRAFHAWTLEVLSSAGYQVCSRLCFEVTETSAVTNFSDAALFIEQIRAVGVRVALDDFGAGASSFGYLKTLPVDYLKIDGQFVKNVVSDPLDDAAVRCFINVARVLGVKTVAEYVENVTVRNHLQDLGVDYVQGYLLHRPSPINDLIGYQIHVNG